ncbi:hypothetical protein FB45DRAFT_282416 [Roridomyces roridus]|uniref:F-box domain-containing protein n=1 Tax=Roridomyces roridus TaxID=1738132 RepID=A0AAD7FUF6_9AGAR|nr:hypothetical protein FB45DRAFT_282416 [Roridomyces roridus]
MPSANELRGLIEDLSKVVALQREILEELEHQLRSAKSDLNTLVDPVAQLPLELSSEIFMQCLSTTADMQAAALLPCVCRSWSDIALATPSLWTTISDDGVPAVKFPQLFEIWLRRGKNLPLSLSLRHIDPVAFADTVEALEEHAYRVQELEILRVGLDLGQITYPFTALETLTLEGSKQEFLASSASEMVEMLRGASKLVECNLLRAYYRDHTPSDLTHCSLQHLRLGRLEDGHSSAVILRHLTLPSLQTLCISRFDISTTDFLQFFTRSSPPLRSLELRLPVSDVASETIACLKLLPDLANLRIIYNWDNVGTFFDKLAAAPDVLPALRDFWISGYLRNLAGYQRVLDVLTRRRKTLRSFHLVVAEEDEDHFSADVGAAFRELVGEGMEIHIGTAVKNFL